MYVHKFILMNVELTKAEEEIMKVLWVLKKSPVKGVLAVLPEPKPAYNTVSTLIRILEKKGLVGHEAKGRGFEYFPLIAQEDYSNQSLNKLIGSYFKGSLSSMVSFFVNSNEIDISELDEILRLIEESKSKKS